MNAAPQKTEIVFFAPSTQGGLYEHSKYQAEALSVLGFNVHLLTCPGAPSHDDSAPYKVVRLLRRNSQSRYRILRQLSAVFTIWWNIAAAARYCRKSRSPILFLESFFEYGAPLWSRILLKLQASGVKIGVNLHDPVRDYRIGPAWWHKLSVSMAYRPLTFALAHQTIPPEAGIPSTLSVDVVPVGVYRPKSPQTSSSTARAKLGMNLSGRTFLFFGFIRDNKNLELAIRALGEVPEARIIVAGSAQSSKDKSIEFYTALAEELNVEDRIRFDCSFIGEEQIGLYFSACDAVLLTYSAEFRSQSGVLNLAAYYRKPVIASAGDSPLIDCVERFRMGRIVSAGCLDELVQAMASEELSSQPDWTGYERYATWESNVMPLVREIQQGTATGR
jgi:glycosyltransferase involved in cell wall biosynthesis